jgi:hypothetical protein
LDRFAPLAMTISSVYDCHKPMFGKGDHRHFQVVETAYVFVSVERLMADFILTPSR